MFVTYDRGLKRNRKAKRDDGAVTCKDALKKANSFTKAIDANYFLGHARL